MLEHYEDIAWLAERGADWHIRKGTAAGRIVGQLTDGAAFEIGPSPSSPDPFCSEDTGPIAAQLFIASPDGNATGVDRTTDWPGPHEAHLLQAKLSLLVENLAAFVDNRDWPAPTEPKLHFYTVVATYYDARLWTKRGDIAAMVRDNTIPWLDGIELPLYGYDRVFYEQTTNRLIEFRAIRIDLW